MNTPNWLLALNKQTGELEGELTVRVPIQPAPVMSAEAVALLEELNSKPVAVEPEPVAEPIVVSTPEPEPLVLRNPLDPFPFDAEAYLREREDDMEWDQDDWNEYPFVGLPEPTPVTVIPSSMPFGPVEPPINGLAAGPEVPWLATMSREMSALYDDHVQRVMAYSPTHAAKLMTVKGFNSMYVGIITDPGMAEKHIKECEKRDQPIGGWDDKYHAHIRRGVQQLQVGFDIKRKVEERTRFNIAIAKSRQAWKDAVERRKLALERMNTEVANLHEGYTQMKNMTFDEWLERLDV